MHRTSFEVIVGRIFRLSLRSIFQCLHQFYVLDLRNFLRSCPSSMIYESDLGPFLEQIFQNIYPAPFDKMQCYPPIVLFARVNLTSHNSHQQRPLSFAKIRHIHLTIAVIIVRSKSNSFPSICNPGC